MNAKRPPLLVRFLPSLADVAFLLPIVFIFAKLGGLGVMLGDGDTGWHIRAGDWMLENRRVPDKDIFSFTMPDKPWYAWEWLWDAIFSFLHRRFGMEGVVLASLFLLCATFFVLYRVVRRRAGNVLAAIAATGLAAAISSIHWLARPHLVTFFFLVVFLAILDRVREGRTKLLFLLPPLTILWTNLHGGFLVGLSLLGALAAGEVVAALVGTDSEGRRKRLAQARTYSLALAGCLASTLLNPYGFRLHTHIYGYLTESYHREFIKEFQSLSFQSPVAVFLEPLLLLVAFTLYRFLGQRRFGDVILLAAWTHLALQMGRNIPILAIIAAPFVAETLTGLISCLAAADVGTWLRRAAQGLLSFAAEIGAIDAVGRLHLASAGLFFVVLAIVFAPNPPERFIVKYDGKKYPEKALSFLADRDLARKRIFTSDEWGDYLIYKLYPSVKVFLDGRSDFYGPDFGKKYIDSISVKYSWEGLFRKHRIDTVLLPVDFALASTMKESDRWQVVYDDGIAIVFRSRNAEPSAWAGARPASGQVLSPFTEGEVSGGGSAAASRH